MADHVEKAISQAKEAAHKAGISLDTQVADTADAIKVSLSFSLEGLTEASMIRTLEQKIEKLQPGSIDATIIYSSRTAWVTAPSSINAQCIIDLFAEYGIQAQLSPTSVSRQKELAEIHERRRRLAEHRHTRGLLLGSLRTLRVEEKERYARESGFLHDDQIYKEAPPKEVLFTARALLTRKRLVVSFFLSLPVFLLCYIQNLQFPYWQWLCLGLSFPVVTWGAWPFHRAALGGARRGLSALDASSSVAIISAYIWSAASMIFTQAGNRDWHFDPQWLAVRYAKLNSGEIFLDVACGITVLLLFGRLMSRRTTHRSLLSQIMSQHIDEKVTVVRKNPNGLENSQLCIPRKEIRAGDDILVPKNTIIPADGEVIGGSSVAVAGPIQPGAKEKILKVKTHCYAGFYNRDADIKIRALRTGSQTRLASMKRWLMEATRHENKSAQIAIRSASYLVPGSLILAAITFFLWWFVNNNVNTAFAAGLAILACVCPVALALSTSLSMRLGVEQAARQGIFLRNAEVLRTLDKITALIFNRMGTLTEEEMSVKTVSVKKGENPDLLLRVAAALAMESDHPVSRAIVRADRESRDAGNSGEEVPHWIDVHNASIDKNGTFAGIVHIPIPNAEGDLETAQVEAKLWRPRDLSELDADLVPAAISGGTPLVVSWKNKARGVITLHDQSKEDAVDAVAALENLGVETVMLTRDTYPVARRFADNLGISKVLAGIAPAKKEASVRSVHASGEIVAMVGDRSIVDCLRVADIGILVGKTADLDVDEADVVILRNEVMAIPNLVILARKVCRLARHNIIFTWSYNGVALFLAAIGLLHPMAATVAMIISSLIVEMSSARVRRF